MALSLADAENEYVGTDLEHIARIMARLSQIYPPKVYPPLGPLGDPRQPIVVRGREWVLGSTTGPDGKMQAPITRATDVGHYYVGSDWPYTDMAPQAILWVPPEYPEARYVGMPDRIGNSRFTSSVAMDTLYPDKPDILTAESLQAPQSGIYSYSRTGSLVSPWKVLCYGNSWADTKLMAQWVASCAHDVERSQAERLGASFTVTRGGWYPDKPGDRGLVWAMTIEITEPIYRSQYNTTFNRAEGGTANFDIVPGTTAEPVEGAAEEG